MHRLRVLITKDTGRPAQYPILQQRRITMRVCVFSIKLGQPITPSTVGESSSKPRPPGGAGEVPTSNRIAVRQRCPPAVSSAGLLQRISETKGAGREANARCSAQQQAEPWSSRSCAALGMATPPFSGRHLVRSEGT